MNKTGKKYPRNKWLLISAVIILVGITACSRLVLEGNRENRDIRIKSPYQAKSTVPFELINNLIVVPVRINNSDTLKFVLDTGAGRTVITELGPDQSFEIEYQGDIRLSGLGTSGSVPALISRGNKIYLRGVEGENHTVVFILEGRFNLSNFMGTQVNGLLGYDIFENFIVEVDYEEGRIYLHDPDAFKDDYASKKEDPSWTEVPLHTQDNKLYMDLVITQSDNSKINARLLVDSGASHTIFLYPDTSDEVVIPSNHIESYLGTGLSGEIFGKIAKARKVELQGMELFDPIVSYPDLEAVEQAIDRDSRNGSVGADLLKRFDIIYNYADSSMLVKPNRNFNDKFRYNVSGLEITTPILNFPYFVVSEVRKDSPADQAGLQRGDVIVELEYERVYNFTLSELLEVFHSSQDKKIKLYIQRGQEFMNFELELKDVLKLDEIIDS